MEEMVSILEELHRYVITEACKELQDINKERSTPIARLGIPLVHQIVMQS